MKSRLALGTLWVTAGSAAQRLSGYLTYIIIARFTDPATMGAAAFVLSLVQLISAVTMQGMPSAAIRYVSHHEAQGSPEAARDMVSRMYWLLLTGGLLVAAAGPLGYYVFFPAEITQHLSAGAFIVFFTLHALLFPLNQTQAGIFIGLRRPDLSASLMPMLNAVVRLGALFVFLSLRPTAGSALLATLAALVVSFVAARMTLARLGFTLRRPDFTGAAEIYRYSTPIIVFAVLNQTMENFGRISLGYFADAAAVGAFFICGRVAYLLAAPMEAVGQTYAPVISAAWSRDDFAGLSATYRKLTYVTLFAIGAIFGLILVNSDLVLGVFGKEYVTDRNRFILLLLCSSMTIRALSGHYDMLFRMTEKNRALVRTSALVLALYLGLNFALVPRFHEIGAAWAALLTMAANVSVAVWAIRTLYGGRVHQFGKQWVLSAAFAAVVATTAWFAIDLAILTRNALIVTMIGVFAVGVLRKELGDIVKTKKSRV